MKLVVFIFIAIIRSIILYKVNTYTKHVRLSYILFFFSSNVTSFYLFSPSSYFFLSHIHTLSLFLSISQSLFHSLFSFCSRIYTPTPLSVSLSSFPRTCVLEQRNRKHVGNCMRDTLLLPRIDREYRHSDEFAIRDKIRRHNYYRIISPPNLLRMYLIVTHNTVGIRRLHAHS